MNDSLLQLTAIVTGTFVSEDATSVSVGLLIREGQVAVWTGVFSCFLGIYLGDLGLWLAGRALGRRTKQWMWLNARLPQQELQRFGNWFDRRGWMSVLASRFVPGTRLPLYVAAGAFGRHPWRFVVWSLVAAAIWTPLVVLGAMYFGIAVSPLKYLLGGWLATVAAGIVAFLALRCAARLATPVGRAKFQARLSRIWRWEFWPGWLFYLPLIPYLGYLALRYRSMTVWTATNPGIPYGGVVGESKFAILSQLPPQWTAPSVLIEGSTPQEQIGKFETILASNHWPLPVILKPDAAQRGAGVKRIGSLEAAHGYFDENRGPILAQQYHPGPHEAGIFYYRHPDEARGRIFSITDKQFPVLVGDGEATVEELIWRHSRYRMQAAVFLKRHQTRRFQVLARGETLCLALAGNHCQGTMFLDGAHLITPALEQSIDAIARGYPGFYFGRFDVRYCDVEEFCQGRGFRVVELNGATSESTNIYDPASSLLSAYRTLARQWRIAFIIGNCNRRRGIQTLGAWSLWQLVRTYYRQLAVNPLAD